MNIDENNRYLYISVTNINQLNNEVGSWNKYFAEIVAVCLNQQVPISGVIFEDLQIYKH